jgi:hypothetical protein
MKRDNRYQGRLQISKFLNALDASVEPTTSFLSVRFDSDLGLLIDRPENHRRRGECTDLAGQEG